MLISSFVDRIDSQSLPALCQTLAENAAALEKPGEWPRKQLELCGLSGVFRWFTPCEHGGLGWNAEDQTRGYLKLAQACLTTTFIITQRMGAVRRIESSENQAARQRWLPGLLTGDLSATVGISHLTTSRRHLGTAVLRATRVPDTTDPSTTGGFILDGYSPWVTGGAHADGIVVGATMDDGRELLAIVPTDLDGITTHPGADLVALSASSTDQVDFDNVRITPDMVLAGPVENVMTHGSGAGTGGVQTSTLAVGLSGAATAFLLREAETRPDLANVAKQLDRDVKELESEVIDAAGGRITCDLTELRGRANRLALRTTQAALTSAKGAGFVAGHPAGRWCREALFFLVWSCPQPVSHAHLCELAGIQT
jgi:alkylation response protein AidB-like acyl-CoA dehydrogenase